MTEPLYIRYFRALCAIPRNSGDTKDVSTFCKVFADAHGLECSQDEYNNIVIKKPATPGYEAHPTVILQGHLDMVCVKEPNCEIDPAKHPLSLCFEGDKLYAKGTSLGADDGIAVAYALAILERNDIPHPPLEVLLTTDEETGMYGANALNPNLIKGRIMLNMDSEKEGLLLAGCAGGARCGIRLPIRRLDASGDLYRITVKGLLGGHSGTEINAGHANANYVLADVIRSLAPKSGISVVSLFGGSKDNAIPQEAYADVLIAQDGDKTLNRILGQLEKEERFLYPNDADLTITWKLVEFSSQQKAIASESLGRLLSLFHQIPNGVQAMSAFDPELVQTSSNLGVVKTTPTEILMTWSLRSSVNAERDGLLEVISASAQSADAIVQVGGQYPAWEYKIESPLRTVMISAFKDLYGFEPQVKTIHAGLECGLFSGKWEGLDCVSFGPNIQDIHTTRETLSLSSAERTWQYLLHVLEKL